MGTIINSNNINSFAINGININGLAKNGTIVYKKAIIENIPLYEWIINNVNTVTSGAGLYHHISSLANGAADNGYRYAGANPNNWIKFNNEDYRIIGIFNNQIKIMKNISIVERVWDTVDNDWDKPSDLNNYLNTEWINTLGNNANLIEPKKWYIGGVNNAKHPPKFCYDKEITQQTKTQYKIGLMNSSDYGFASQAGVWRNNLNTYNKKGQETNWIHCSDNSNIWTITLRSGNATNVFHKLATGALGMAAATVTKKFRPTFYLKSTVKYISGNGSQTNPFIIE